MIFDSLSNEYSVQISGPFLVGNFFSDEITPMFIVTKRIVDLENRAFLRLCLLPFRNRILRPSLKTICL